MPRNAAGKDLNLKSLELFQICAKQGSMQAAARETGLTLSTVSHHLRNLETHLGVDLFDHARRPMVLTPKGRSFLRDIEGALLAIRKAKAEVSVGNLAGASYLRLGTIEDFETDMIPDLAVYLSSHMPGCDFLFRTGSSHMIFDMLRDRQLDVGITATPGDRQGDLIDRPLLRDPFVVVLPLGAEQSLGDVMADRTKLPFLRYSSDLMIARQIDTQLKRMGVNAAHRFECSSSQTLMAMVAAGAGWAITTPLLFSRARRFHARLRMHRFPGKSFARELALVANPDCSDAVVDLIDTRLRSLLRDHALGPLKQANPWLEDSFRLLT
jgi:DNA-binding transcriptional LysR family regulator